MSRVVSASIRLIGLVLGILEALLIVRIVLMFLAANPTAGFSSLIYGWTAPLVVPFQGVFPYSIAVQGFTLDVAAILAIVVYALAAWLLEAVARTLTRL